MGVWVLAAAIVLAGTIIAGVVFLRTRRGPTDQELESQRIAEMRADNIEQSVQNLMSSTSDLAGRMSQLAEAQNRSQAGMMKALEERLDAVKLYMGRSLTEQTDRTSNTLHQLQNRLSMIDEAQKNIATLSGNVTSLQDMLTGSRSKGLFGELQMQDLVTTSLPPSAYSFGKVMPNGRKADCLIELPNPPGPIVIDAQFSLDTYHALREAKDEVAVAQAERAFRNAVLKHVVDIAERFIIAGDTAESALMFLPSESIYAELHAHFPDVVEKSFRARVWIVSPTTLMATLNTVRGVLKDAKMREQAQVIHKETGLMLDDVSRLQKRVLNLQAHFGQTEKDVREILIAADKIARRAERIEEVQIGTTDTSAPAMRTVEAPKAAGSAPLAAPKAPVASAAPVEPIAAPRAPVSPAPAPIKPMMAPMAKPATPTPATPAPATVAKAAADKPVAPKADPMKSRDPASVWAGLWLSAMTGKPADAAKKEAAPAKPAPAPAASPAASKVTVAKVPNAFMPTPAKPAAPKAADLKPVEKKEAAPKPTPVVPTAAAISFADIAEDLAEFGVPLAPLSYDRSAASKASEAKTPVAQDKPTLSAPDLRPLAGTVQPKATDTLAKAAAGKPAPAAAPATAKPSIPHGSLNPYWSLAMPKAPAKAETPKTETKAKADLAPRKLPTQGKVDLPKAESKPAASTTAKPLGGHGHAIYFPAMSLAPKATATDKPVASAAKPTASANPFATASKTPAEAEKRAAADSSIPEEPDFDIEFDDRPTIWPLV
ncbi:MAG: DNA recombination protein RmuC [Alphaproteobacteria bacterium]